MVEYARDVGKPIVIEKLDFRQKKAVLEGDVPQVQPDAFFLQPTARSRPTSSPAAIVREWRLHQVNPAFSSVMGRVKFMERYGLSVHQAAALVLARRLLGCSERIPRQRVAPVGNGVHVAFTVPARKGVKHVWTYWGAISQATETGACSAIIGWRRQRRRSNPAQAGRAVFRHCGVA